MLRELKLVSDVAETELSGFTDAQRVQVQQHACETMLAINSHNSDSLLRRVHASAAFLLKNPLFLLRYCLCRRHLIRRGVLGSVAALGTLLGLRWLGTFRLSLLATPLALPPSTTTYSLFLLWRISKKGGGKSWRQQYTAFKRI